MNIKKIRYVLVRCNRLNENIKKKNDVSISGFSHSSQNRCRMMHTFKYSEWDQSVQTDNFTILSYRIFSILGSIFKNVRHNVLIGLNVINKGHLTNDMLISLFRGTNDQNLNDISPNYEKSCQCCILCFIFLQCLCCF